MTLIQVNAIRIQSDLGWTADTTLDYVNPEEPSTGCLNQTKSIKMDKTETENETENETEREIKGEIERERMQGLVCKWVEG